VLRKHYQLLFFFGTNNTKEEDTSTAKPIQVRYRKIPAILRLAVAIHCGRGEGVKLVIYAAFKLPNHQPPPPSQSEFFAANFGGGGSGGGGGMSGIFIFTLFYFNFSIFLLSESLNSVVFYNFQKFHTHDFI